MRGGGGGGFGDPNQMFDRLANGKEFITKADAGSNPFMSGMFDRMVTDTGSTDGKITRAQFSTAMASMRQNRGGGMGGGGFGGGPPGGGGGGDRTLAMADTVFKSLDKNGDGVLNNDEMPEALKQEREKWDTNKDGLIQQEEFRPYFQARMQQFQAERLAAGGGFQGGPGAQPELPPDLAPPESEKRPVVYRAGKLPMSFRPGLPSSTPTTTARSASTNGKPAAGHWTSSKRWTATATAFSRSRKFSATPRTRTRPTARPWPAAWADQEEGSGVRREVVLEPADLDREADNRVEMVAVEMAEADEEDEVDGIEGNDHFV